MSYLLMMRKKTKRATSLYQTAPSPVSVVLQIYACFFSCSACSIFSSIFRNYTIISLCIPKSFSPLDISYRASSIC